MQSFSNRDPFLLSPFEGLLGLFVSFVLIFIFFSFTRSAYTVPDNRYIIVADTVELGSIDILVPIGSRSSFRLSGNTPVNISSSTITCFTNYQNQDYSIRFTTFGVAEYRPSSSTTTWRTLTFNSVSESSTIQFLSELDTSQLNDTTILNLLFLGISVFICYLLLRRS